MTILKLLSVQVNFLTKLVALKPGKTVEEMIKNVMEGKDEGAEDTGSDEEDTTSKKGPSGIAGRVNLSTVYSYDIFVNSACMCKCAHTQCLYRYCTILTYASLLAGKCYRTKSASCAPWHVS